MEFTITQDPKIMTSSMLFKSQTWVFFSPQDPNWDFASSNSRVENIKMRRDFYMLRLFAIHLITWCVSCVQISWFLQDTWVVGVLSKQALTPNHETSPKVPFQSLPASLAWYPCVLFPPSDTATRAMIASAPRYICLGNDIMIRAWNHSA